MGSKESWKLGKDSLENCPKRAKTAIKPLVPKNITNKLFTQFWLGISGLSRKTAQRYKKAPKIALTTLQEAV